MLGQCPRKEGIGQLAMKLSPSLTGTLPPYRSQRASFNVWGMVWLEQWASPLREAARGMVWRIHALRGPTTRNQRSVPRINIGNGRCT